MCNMKCFTFDEQLFVVVVTVRMSQQRRRIATAKVQPPGQRPAIVIAAAAKLVVVFQTFDGVAFNLALHDRPVFQMTNGTLAESATAGRRRLQEDHDGTPLHATDVYPPPQLWSSPLMSIFMPIEYTLNYEKRKQQKPERLWTNGTSILSKSWGSRTKAEYITTKDATTVQSGKFHRNT